MSAMCLILCVREPQIGHAIPEGISKHLNTAFSYCGFFLTGSHISEVVQENEALKQRLELLERQPEQERDAFKADALQAKEELCRSVCQCEHISMDVIR